jgi:hypothetical protein
VHPKQGDPRVPAVVKISQRHTLHPGKTLGNGDVGFGGIRRVARVRPTRPTSPSWPEGLDLQDVGPTDKRINSRASKIGLQ